MKHLRLFLASLILLVGTLAAWAEDAVTFKPFFWLSIKSCDAMMTELKQLSELGKDPMLYSSVEQLIQSWTGEEFLQKLDKNAPIVFAVDQNIEGAVLYLPFGDQDALVNFLCEKLEDASIQTQEDGITSVTDSGSTGDFYVKVANGWTYFSTSLPLLKVLPANPEDCFGKPTETMGLTLQLETLPPGFREILLGDDELTEEDLDAENERFNEMSAEEQEEFLDEAESTDLARRQLSKFLAAVRSVMLGTSLKLDSSTLNVLLDCVVKSDSEMAGEMKKAGSVSPKFAGFAVQNALFSGQGVSILDEHVKKGLMKDLKKDWRKAQKEGNTTDQAVCEVQETYLTALLKQDAIQYGVTWQCQDGKNNFVMGYSAPEPQALDTAFRALVDLMAKEMGDKFDPNSVKYEADSLNGVTFHTWTLATSEAAKLIAPDDASEKDFAETEKDLKFLLGDSLQFAVGFGDGMNFLGFGNSPLELLKACLAPAEVKQPVDSAVQRMGYATLSLKEFLQVAEQLVQNQMAELEKELATSPAPAQETAPTENAEKGENASEENLDEDGFEAEVTAEEDDPETQLREAKSDLRIIQLMQKIVGDAPDKVVVTADLTENKLTYKATLETGATKLMGSLRKLITLMAM